jgi:MazG family protein
MPIQNCKSKIQNAAAEVVSVMAKLRAPDGCPWDREQTHESLCAYAVEEVYELIDAIEAGDDGEMVDELGDLLLQVVFHCQIASERGAFDFETVCRRLVEKLIRRHPHVFGDVEARTVDAVWANWERIKKEEKQGTRHARASALDGIPGHLPALLRAEKLIKKARKAKLLEDEPRRNGRASKNAASKTDLAAKLFELVEAAQRQGWSAEELLRAEIKKRDRALRRQERKETSKRPTESR